LNGKRKNSDFLFPNPKGARISTNSIRNIITKAANRCDFEDKITPHTFRRSFATNLYRSGADLYSIMRKMGHTSIRTTQLYLHISEKDLETTINPL